MSRAALSPSRFAQVPDALLADASISATAVRVYAIIVRYQGRHEVAWPGLRRVAFDYGIPRSTVSDAVAELEAGGWLVCERRPGTSTLYQPVEKVSGGPDTVSGGPDGVSGGPDVTRATTESHDRGTPRPPAEAAGEVEEPEVVEGQVDDLDPEHRRLAVLLADLVEANGSLRPGTGPAAVKVIRLMVERDGRTTEQIEKAIRWSQADPFWRGVVLSPRKLRDKYDQLRLAAQRSGARRESAHEKAQRERAERRARLEGAA